MGGDVLSRRKIILAFIAVLGVAIFLSGHAVAQEKSIVVASTTSLQDSGLYGHLLPLFTQKTGIAVKMLALGTGQALDTGRRGEGVKRFPVMYNDFVLIGPRSDPAGVKGMNDIAKAFKTIRDKQATFISRGDHSGTHLAELALWNKDVGIDIEMDNGAWYKSVGRGMDAALHKASMRNGYILSDRGTWIHFRNKYDLQILVEGDKGLISQYSAILVNPDKHPNVKKDLGQAFIDWLVSPDGQKAIADYKINGEQLFYPNADDPNA